MATDPGLRLKRIRESLGLRYRQVESASNLIAQRRHNTDFTVGLSRLADIENKGVVPSLHRLYSLCAIYHLDFDEALAWYGIDMAEYWEDASYAHAGQTHPLGARSANRGSVTLPLELDPGVDFRKTTYLSRMIQRWGKVPLMLLSTLNVDEGRYALIGAEDYFMHPLLRPGALVQIDDKRTEIQTGGWQSDWERPIYLFELRQGFACCWCNVAGDRLILQPHPLSSCEPKILDRRTEVDVLGQVTGVAMQLIEPEAPKAAKRKTRSAAIRE